MLLLVFHVLGEVSYFLSIFKKREDMKLYLLFVFLFQIFIVLFMHRYDLFQAAQAITPNIIMFLPRNVDLLQVEELCWLSSPPLEFEVWLYIQCFRNE